MHKGETVTKINFKKNNSKKADKNKWKLEPGTNLEEACEDVKLKHGNVVIAGEVNRRFKGHSFQARADVMHFM